MVTRETGLEYEKGVRVQAFKGRRKDRMSWTAFLHFFHQSRKGNE